jgi:predicted esterase
MKITLYLAVMAATLCAYTAEWQWSIDTEGRKPGKAFLWIPPDCDYVRGVFFGQQVILEQAVFEDPQIRAACAKEGIAILFLVPGRIGYDDFGPKGKGASTYNGIVKALAEKSGYSELEHAPFITIGHSGGAIWAWRMGYLKPDRCFGVIGLRAAPIGPPSHLKKHDAELNGVPTLVITGQYETWNPKQGSEHHWRWCRADMLAWRAKWLNFLGSVLVQPGAGHFNWNDKVAAHVSMFIQKAAQARIPKAKAPAGQYPKLKVIKKEDGWLTDNTLTTPSNVKTAAYKDYTGDPSMAFWHIDEELARANEAFGQTHGKKLQLVTAVDKDGKSVASGWMQGIDFVPQEDGITMSVKADFVKQTPDVFQTAGNPATLGHAKGPIQFRLIGSWGGGGEQVNANTFRIRFDRFTLASGRPGVMFMMWHPGDTHYAYTEQPCSLKFPRVNKQGKDQVITFDTIPNQKAGVRSIDLKAASDADMPVRFAVIDGPVMLDGNKLVFTKVPPRATYPIHVTIAAYQWGRHVVPKVKSATTVYQHFKIQK